MKCNLIFWVNGTHQIDCKKKDMIHFRKWEKQNIFKYISLISRKKSGHQMHKKTYFIT